MTSIKIKFRPSSVEGKEGSIYFQIIHNRVVRQLNTAYRIFASEWDEETETIIANGDRINIINAIKERMAWDIARLEKTVAQLETKRGRYSADEVITVYHKLTNEVSLFSFWHNVIAQLKQLGKVRTAETYTASLKSFMQFLDNQDIPLDGITSDMMLLYEAYLKARGVRMNTISFYMRIFRAVYTSGLSITA